jgi:hypothetical protein
VRAAVRGLGLRVSRGELFGESSCEGFRVKGKQGRAV